MSHYYPCEPDATGRILTVSSEGKCMVWGACLLRNLFSKRMFAKVPLAITASLPRREPYELNSLGVNLKRQKGLVLRILKLK